LLQQVRSIFSQQLTQGAIEEVSMYEITGRIGNYFAAEEWRLQRLVRTEMMGVYSLGKLNGMKRLVDDEIPDLKKTLFHPMDKRTGADSKILNRNNPIVSVDEPFTENESNAGLKNGRERVYMFPPGRPNDRAILIPYREAWAN
jgi:hypothetical protein